MTLEIALPIRDPGERITGATIHELPTHLLDPEERAIAREAFTFFKHAAGARGTTVGTAAAVVESLPPHERKGLLDVLRRRAGLPSVADIEADRSRAVQEARIFDDRPRELRMTASGAIIDALEADEAAAAARAFQESLDARREAQIAARALEAERIAAFQATVDERAREELPAGLG